MNTSTAVSANGVPVLTIDERLYIARRRTGLDAKAFAERTAISRATVNNYENPRYERSRKSLYLKAWAMACGVSYTWLTTGEEPPSPENDPGINGEREFACTRTPATVTQLRRVTDAELSPHAA